MSAGAISPLHLKFPPLFAAIGNSYAVKQPGQGVDLSSDSLVHAAQMGASHLPFQARASTFASEGIYCPSREHNHKIP